MKTRRLGVETLEKRFVLSGLGLTGSGPIPIDHSQPEDSQGALVAEQSLGTYVELEDGQRVLLFVPPENPFGDLSGVAFELTQSTGPLTPEVAGVISEGAYTPDGILSMLGTGQMLSPFEIADQSLQLTLSGGSVDIQVQQNAFKSATFSEVAVAANISVPDASTPLKLKGSIENGTYKPGEGITFDAELELAEDFTYEKSPFTATLEKGGRLQVDVQNNAFKGAELTGVVITASVKVSDASDTLKLRGSLTGGSYKPAEGITFDAHLKVTDDFVYEKSPVTATLKDGGSVQADVQKGEFKKAVFGADENLLGEVDILVPDSTGLKLDGQLQGKYENDLIDLDCTLTLRETFEYTRPAVVARLTNGAVSVKVERSEFKWAELNVSGEVDVTIPNTNGLKLEGTLQGNYDAGGLDVTGELTLRSDFEYSHKRVSARIAAGQLTDVQIRGGDIIADLTGAVLEATVRRRATSLVFEGTVKSGTVSNDRLDLAVHAELQSTTILPSRGRFQRKLIDASLDLLIVDGRLTRLRLSDWDILVCR